MSDIHGWIDQQIKSNDVLLFMKGNKATPQCGFSDQVVRILEHIGIDFQDHDVLSNAELRDGIKIYSDWPTIPQLYVKGEFIGGCDIIREMFQSGELLSLMRESGISVNDTANT